MSRRVQNERRLFASGNSLVVSLPPDWVRRHRLRVQDSVTLEETETGICIEPVASTSKQTVIKADGLDRTFLRCYLRSAYKKGYDTITVHYTTKELFHHRTQTAVPITEIVQQEVRGLLGFEIIEQTEGRIVLTSLSSPVDVHLDVVLRRLFRQLLSYSEFLLSSLRGKDNLEGLENQHDALERLSSYCIRVLQKGGAQTPFLFHILASLDLVTDIIKYSGRLLNEVEGSVDPKTIVLAQKVHSFLEGYYDLYYAFDNKKIGVLSKKRNDFLQAMKTVQNTKDRLFLLRYSQVMEVLYLLIESRQALELKDA